MGIYSTSIFHYVSRKHCLGQKTAPPHSAAAQACSQRKRSMTLLNSTTFFCGEFAVFTKWGDAKDWRCNIYASLMHSSVSDSKWDELEYVIESRRCLLASIGQQMWGKHWIKVRGFGIKNGICLCMICFYCLWQENLISATHITICNLILHHCLNPLSIIYAQGCCWNQIIANPI